MKVKAKKEFYDGKVVRKEGEVFEWPKDKCPKACVPVSAKEAKAAEEEAEQEGEAEAAPAKPVKAPKAPAAPKAPKAPKQK